MIKNGHAVFLGDGQNRKIVAPEHEKNQKKVAMLNKPVFLEEVGRKESEQIVFF